MRCGGARARQQHAAERERASSTCASAHARGSCSLTRGAIKAQDDARGARGSALRTGAAEAGGIL